MRPSPRPSNRRICLKRSRAPGFQSPLMLSSKPVSVGGDDLLRRSLLEPFVEALLPARVFLGAERGAHQVLRLEAVENARRVRRDVGARRDAAPFCPERLRLLRQQEI